MLFCNSYLTLLLPSDDTFLFFSLISQSHKAEREMEVLQEIFLTAFFSLFFAFLLAKFLSFVFDSEKSSQKSEKAVQGPAAVGLSGDGNSRRKGQRVECGLAREEKEKVRFGEVRYCDEVKETTETVEEVCESPERPDSGGVTIEDCELRSVHAPEGVEERDESCGREIVGEREVCRDKEGTTPDFERDHVSELLSSGLGGNHEANLPIEPTEGEVLEETVDDDSCVKLKAQSEAHELANILEVMESQAIIDVGMEPEQAKKNEQDQENGEKDREGRSEENQTNVGLEIDSEPTKEVEAHEGNSEKDQDEGSEENRVILADSEPKMEIEEHETVKEKDRKEQSGADEKEGGVIDEEGWEGIERSETAKLFTVAESFVASPCGSEIFSKLGNDVQMHLYGLQKAATEGPCYESQPSALKPAARAKWHAWQRLGSMNPEAAMVQYIALLSESIPDWQAAVSRECQEINGCSGSEATAPSSETQDLSSSRVHQLTPHGQRTVEEIHACTHGNVDFGVAKIKDGSSPIGSPDHPTGDSSSSG